MIVERKRFKPECFEKASKGWNIAITVNGKNRHARNIERPQRPIRCLKLFSNSLERRMLGNAFRNDRALSEHRLGDTSTQHDACSVSV